MRKLAIFSTNQLLVNALSWALSRESGLKIVVIEITMPEFLKEFRQKPFDGMIIDVSGLGDQDLQLQSGARLMTPDLRSIALGDVGDQYNFDRVLGPDFPIEKLPEVIREVVLDKGPLIIHEAEQGRGRGRPRQNVGGFELSHREYEVASLIAKAYTNQEIVTTTGIKEQGVKNLVSAVIRKLHCKNRVAVAFKIRGIDLEE